MIPSREEELGLLCVQVESESSRTSEKARIYAMYTYTYGYAEIVDIIHESLYYVVSKGFIYGVSLLQR